MTPPIEEVTWLDHWCDESDLHPHEFIEEVEVTSVGYLVRETPDLVSLSQSLNNQGQFSSTLHILKPLIRSRRRIRPGTQPRKGARK